MRYFNRAQSTVKENETGPVSGLPCWQKCQDKTFWRNGPVICQCNFTARCVINLKMIKSLQVWVMRLEEDEVLCIRKCMSHSVNTEVSIWVL